MRTVFVNATFHTMQSEDDICHSLSVEDGIITALDEETSWASAGLPQTKRGNRDSETLRIVDLHGAHVYPALIDSHAHMLEAIALSSMGASLCSVQDGAIEPHDLDGIAKAIKAYMPKANRSKPIVFSSYITAAVAEGRLPNRFELDEWTDGAQVWVMNIDGHSSSCSSSFLDAVGLADIAPDGIFAGKAHDANYGAFLGHVSSAVTPAVLARGIARFCNECARYGIGTTCALEGADDAEDDAITRLFVKLAQHFPLDVRMFPQYMDLAKLDAVLPSMSDNRVGGCMKWELDGSVGSCTAAFSNPFKNGKQGLLYFDTEFLEKTISDFAERGFMVSAHAIGELAIEQLVGILEKVPGRHRIDHCEFPSPQTVERIIELKPYVTIQPGYSWIDKHYMHGYENYLDDVQINQQVPLRTLSQAGVPLLGSSDAPVQSVDPFLQMRGMREFYVEDQSISAFEALKTYTVNAGEMLGEQKGMLREGYEASFFTLEDDLLTMPSEGLENLQALALYMRGKLYSPLPENATTYARLLVSPARKV